MALRPQARAAAIDARAYGLDQARVDEGLRQHMLRIYNYMATGLAISGLVSWLIANTALQSLFFQTTPDGRLGFTALGMIGMFAPLGMLFLAMFVRNMSAGATQAFYWAFVALQGVGLSILLMTYTSESVVRVFLITASAFAGLSLFGYTTKRNLSGFGQFLLMGLIGLIIAMVVNIFFPSSMLTFVISVAGVLIFAGLIAFDTQRLKNEYVGGLVQGGDSATIHAVWGALSLYISFINLFQFLLMFLGNRE